MNAVSVRATKIDSEQVGELTKAFTPIQGLYCLLVYRLLQAGGNVVMLAQTTT